MLNIDTESHIGNQAASVKLTHAILLYRSQNALEYASAHPVELDDHSRPQILAGKPLTKQAIRKMLNDASNRRVGLILNHERLLASTEQSVLWFCPTAVRKAFIRHEDFDGVVDLVYPNLIFLANTQSLSVFSYKGKERPNAQTVLHHAPLFNIFNNNKLCFGNLRASLNSDPNQTIAQYESMFFDSTFTHPNSGTSRFTNFKGSILGLWKHLVGKKPRKFPEKFLNPILTKSNQHLTLGAFINGIE